MTSSQNIALSGVDDILSFVIDAINVTQSVSAVAHCGDVMIDSWRFISSNAARSTRLVLVKSYHGTSYSQRHIKQVSF